MPSYPTTPTALFSEKNKIATTELEDYFRQMQQRRWYDAMVTQANPEDYANRYIVNIHARGLSGAPSHRQIPATNLESSRLYLKGWPCQVCYDGRMCIMRAYPGPVGFKLADEPSSGDKISFPRRLPGWIGDPIFGTYYSADDSGNQIVASEYKVYFTWNYQTLNKPVDGRGISDTITGLVTLDDAPKFDWDKEKNKGQLGFMWPRPTIIKDKEVESPFTQSSYVSSGIIVAGGSVPSTDLIGKVSSYTPGENSVTLTPCNEAGTATGDPDVTVKITLPASRTVCSIVDLNTNDVLTYRVTGTLKYLTSVPLPKSTTVYDYLGIQAGSGLSGFDTVRFK